MRQEKEWYDMQQSSIRGNMTHSGSSFKTNQTPKPLFELNANVNGYLVVLVMDSGPNLKISVQSI